MTRNTAIQKTIQSAELELLTEEVSIARRGLDDLQQAAQIHELQDKMLAQFKAAKYSACIKLCEKILEVDPQNTLVKAMFVTSKKRLRESAKNRR